MHYTCSPPGITWSAECACGGRRAPWLHIDHDGSWCRSDRMHCMFNVGVHMAGQAEHHGPAGDGYGPHRPTPRHPQHQAMVRRVYAHGGGTHQSVDWWMCAWYVLNMHICMVHTHHIQRWEGACTTHARPRASHVVLNVHVGAGEPYGCHMDHDGSWCRGDRMHCMFSVYV